MESETQSSRRLDGEELYKEISRSNKNKVIKVVKCDCAIITVEEKTNGLFVCREYQKGCEYVDCGPEEWDFNTLAEALLTAIEKIESYFIAAEDVGRDHYSELEQLRDERIIIKELVNRRI